MGVGGKSQPKLFAILLSVTWALFYHFRVKEHAVVKYQRTFWNTHIVEKARLTRETFRPVFWAYNRHAQTVVCLMITQLEWIWAKKVRVERETLLAWDGNFQYVDWLHLDSKRSRSKRQINSRFNQDAPILLLIHGLGDDNDHPYMKRMARIAKHHGWRTAAFSYWRIDLSEYRDLQSVVNHLHKTNPRAPIIAIAWSAGGHLLLKYLGKVGKNTPVVAAISLSGCFDFVQAVSDVQANESASYRLFLGVQTAECARRHLANDKHITDRQKFAQMTRLSAARDPLGFYDRFVFEMGRYSDIDQEEHAKKPYTPFVNTASHYANSAASVIDKVGVSTLIMHAVDDPVVSHQHIDWETVVGNKHIITITTRRGGHVSWYEDFLPFGATWSDRVATNFISAVLETHSQTNFLLDVFRRSLIEQPNTSVNVTPDTLARICSASDLSSWDLQSLQKRMI
eukprot:CAMPEP_0175134140 /NCGR_PEP_ID=MMETSP0087-20121206/8023_1 /TAXON_ID=136419 /ORGANISM="Unknown Unknown, Strain D1" /LENGTH=453 /DNA_ID=CAMNT_0016416689 /DNA_START=216 /DNA_END=1577 /DNA_ORIENTATION=-